MSAVPVLHRSPDVRGCTRKRCACKGIRGRERERESERARELTVTNWPTNYFFELGEAGSNYNLSDLQPHAVVVVIAVVVVVVVAVVVVVVVVPTRVMANGATQHLAQQPGHSKIARCGATGTPIQQLCYVWQEFAVNVQLTSS